MYPSARPLTSVLMMCGHRPPKASALRRATSAMSCSDDWPIRCAVSISRSLHAGPTCRPLAAAVANTGTAATLDMKVRRWVAGRETGGIIGGEEGISEGDATVEEDTSALGSGRGAYC